MKLVCVLLAAAILLPGDGTISWSGVSKMCLNSFCAIYYGNIMNICHRLQNEISSNGSVQGYRLSDVYGFTG